MWFLSLFFHLITLCNRVTDNDKNVSLTTEKRKEIFIAFAAQLFSFVVITLLWL